MSMWRLFDNREVSTACSLHQCVKDLTQDLPSMIKYAHQLPTIDLRPTRAGHLRSGFIHVFQLHAWSTSSHL